MCQVFDPVHPASGPGAIAWPDDPHGRYAGALSKDGRHLPFAMTLEFGRDGLSAMLDVPALGVVGAPFAVAAYEPPTIVLGMPGTGEQVHAWSGVVDGDRIAGQWQGGGIAATFEMTRCPIEPAPFTVQELAFQGHAGRLSGSLIRPLGVGPHPAALHMPASDAASRDESRFLAQFLARHGVASLIVDAPGVGRSTGRGYGGDVDARARDAVIGMRLLRRADGIDATRVGLFAGGPGALAAPVAACLLGDPAFLVLQSAPLAPQVDPWRLVRPHGLPDDGARPERLDRTFQPATLLAALDAPILAFYGERDAQLPALRCAETLVDLRRGHGSDVTVHVFPDADHGLIQRPPPTAPFDWPRLAAGYLPALAAWLQTKVLRQPVG